MTRGLLEHLNHELRSPMTVIVGMTDLLLMTADDESQRLLQSVKQAADAMLRTLDEAIDFSRLETAVALELAREEFNPGEIARQAAQSLAKGAAAIQLDVAVETAVPDRLTGDTGRLRSIIEGLARSAAKLRPGRAFDLRVLADRADSGMVLHFLLGKQGALAEPRQLLEATFDTATGEPLRLADFAHRGFFGAGLSLPVAAGLAERMRGEVWMSGATAAAVVFRCTVRVGLAAGQAPADFLAAIEKRFTASEPIASRNILLAEDTETNREFFRTALEQRGHQVVSVVDGQAALVAFQSNAARPFDVILLDVEMPHLDGRETAAALRRLRSFSERPAPIIALTAHQIAGDATFSAGGLFDAALTKPCDLSRLYALIENLAAGRPPPGIAGAPPHTPAAGERVDYRGTLRRLDGNQQLFYDLRRFFLEDAPNVLENLRAAFDQRDCEGIERAAHSLKSLVANFGASQATNLATQLQAIAQQRNLAQAPAVFERLAEEVGLLRRELETTWAPSN